MLPHFKFLIYFDAYFLSSSSSDKYFKFYIDNTAYVDRDYKQSDLPYDEDNCRSDYDDNFDYKSYRFEINHSSDDIYIKFCSNVRDEGGGGGKDRRFGLRNI